MNLRELTGETGTPVYVNPNSVAAVTQSNGAINVWLHATRYPVRVLADSIEQVAFFLSGSKP